MIVIIDHYDSFVHNLDRMVQELGYETKLYQCDKVNVEEVVNDNPTHLILSPGPCTPKESGISKSLVNVFKNQIPILGVCLGHQIIAEAFGASIVKARRPMHGQFSMIDHAQRGLLKSFDSPVQVGRYHSLVVEEASFPKELEIISYSAEGDIMAFCHKQLPLHGLQFHPESILTPQGFEMIRRFVLSRSMNDYQ